MRRASAARYSFTRSCGYPATTKIDCPRARREEMSTSLSLSELIEYTDWERGKLHDWFRQRGDSGLATRAGPHGDGRFQTVADLVRHMVSGETRYVDTL